MGGTLTDRQVIFYTALREELIRTGFGGRCLPEWTCYELRRLIRLFDASASFQKGHVKLDLCRQLLAIRPRPLTVHEQQGVNAVRDGEEVWKARSHFRRIPSYVQRHEIKAAQASVLCTSDDPVHPPSGETRECRACLELKFVTDFPTPVAGSACQHVGLGQCKTCYEEHIIAKADVSEFDKIRCPESRCDAYLNTLQLQLYSKPEFFERYEAALTTQFMSQDSSYFTCAGENCAGGGYVDEQTTSFVKCDTCTTETCIRCDTIWHPGVSCADNLAEQHRRAELERSPEKREQEAKTKAEKAKMRRCPGCRAWTQKDGGCDHMTCSRCGTNWCARCAVSYAAINREGNSAHKKSCPHYRPRPRRNSTESTSSDDSAVSHGGVDVEDSDVEFDAEASFSALQTP